MVVKIEKMKTVVLCSNRDFKQYAINLLNTAALPGEKRNTDNIEEMKAIIEQDPLVYNIIVDCEQKSKDELVEYINECFPLPVVEGRRLITLVMLNSEEHEGLDKALTEKFNDAFFFMRPLTQGTVIDIFHKARKFPPGYRGDKNKSTANENPNPVKSEKIEEKKPNTINFVETTGHVRETIENLNKLGKDLSAVAEMQNVGQKFNGIIGAFAFYGERSGYKELFALSSQIDDVCRVYESSRGPVDKKHFDFTLRAAKTAFMILKNLRDGEPVPPEQTNEVTEITALFGSLEGIQSRQSQSQDDVDNLLDELQKTE